MSLAGVTFVYFKKQDLYYINLNRYINLLEPAPTSENFTPTGDLSRHQNWSGVESSEVPSSHKVIIEMLHRLMSLDNFRCDDYREAGTTTTEYLIRIENLTL